MAKSTSHCWIKHLFYGYSFCALTVFFFACTTEKGTPDEIVLIFQKAKVQGNYYHEKDSFQIHRVHIEYLDDHHIVRTFEPDSSLAYDTLVISIHRDDVEVAHTYRGRGTLAYIFNRGDSVLFTYERGKPLAKLINRDRSDLAVNYDRMWRDRFPGRSRPAHERNALLEFFSRKAQSENFEETKEIINQISLEIEAAAIREKDQELTFLDSLRDAGALPEQAYQYRRSNALLYYKRKELEKTLQPFSRFPTEMNIEAQHLSIHETKDGLKVPIFDNVLDERYDSLLSQFAYRHLLRSYHEFYGRKVKRITDRQDYNGMPGGLINRPDFLERYDSLEHSKLFSSQTRKHILLKELENIIENRSIEDKEAYLRRFEDAYSDSVAMEYLREKFALGESSGGNKEHDLQLLQANGDEISFHEVLQQHRGKVIYVDFWSSTCRPCIGEMPYSKKLKTNYKDKEVTFLYLSLENNTERWLNASETHQIQENNYFISNKYSSSEFEDLQVNWIPHYMIYDKEGELVEQFAPRPSEERIDEVFAQYL